MSGEEVAKAFVPHYYQLFDGASLRKEAFSVTLLL